VPLPPHPVKGAAANTGFVCEMMQGQHAAASMIAAVAIALVPA
jgi:hypothetical protein